MDRATWWGLIFLIYIVVGGGWIFSRMNDDHEKMRARRAFYPGNKEAQGNEKWWLPALWILGLAGLCATYFGS